MIDKFCRKMKFNYPQEMFIRMTIAGFIIMIAILFLTSCSNLTEQELEGRELVEASCEELYGSIEKCDTTGIRFPGAREQCKTNHLMFIKEKCLEED